MSCAKIVLFLRKAYGQKDVYFEYKPGSTAMADPKIIDWPLTLFLTKENRISSLRESREPLFSRIIDVRKFAVKTAGLVYSSHVV